MAQKNIKNGKYAVKELPALRAKINREFLIRLQPKEGKSQLVGFTRLCLIIGDLHAEHYAKKALSSKETAPRFSMGAGKGMQVVFFPR